jgi:hypothetical protein
VGSWPDPKSKDINWLTSGQAHPDLQLGVYAKMGEDNDFNLRVMLHNNEIQQWARFIESNVLEQTGDISSIIDLGNANLFVEGVNLLAGQFDLRCIELEIQPGRSIWIPRSEMQVNTDFFPLYFYHIPSDLSKLSDSCIH